MEAGENLGKRKVKEVPPVPIKTYKWEDIRREKRQGKYPYTYLIKGPYIEMEEEKEKKPSDGEKKVRKVRKVKKKVEDTSKKDENNKNEGNKEVLLEQLDIEETEITTIKLKDQPEIPESKTEPEVVPKIEPKQETESEKMETEDVPLDKTEKKSENVPIEKIDVITGTSNLSLETSIDERKIEIISPDTDNEMSLGKETKDEKLEKNIKDSDKNISLEMEPEDEKLEEQKDVTDKISIDLVSIGVVSKSTESEDTFTESNIDQYLDKEEPSKSVSDTSCLEATTSMSDAELPLDSKQLSTQDKKRKHSSLSELTKSNLSLFEKMKNAKFKAPTFKIPKFKKMTFGRKSSKRVKTESIPKTVARSEVQRKEKSESPVYIRIPLNPTPEELEQERIKSETMRTHAGSSESTNGNGRIDTNGTTTTEVRIVSSKRKSKPDKKSPPIKKKGGKKSSPRSSPPVSQKRSDSPVEYIHIPLTGPLPPELVKRAEEMKQDVFENVTNSPKQSPKGAIRKKPGKSKDPEYKLAKDIKKLASKLKGIQKKNKKVLGSKITSKTAKEESKPTKKSNKPDSPVQYIHIPLTGPLPENFAISTSTSKLNEDETDKNSQEITTAEKPEEKVKLEEENEKEIQREEEISEKILETEDLNKNLDKISSVEEIEKVPENQLEVENKKQILEDTETDKAQVKIENKEQILEETETAKAQVKIEDKEQSLEDPETDKTQVKIENKEDSLGDPETDKKQVEIENKEQNLEHTETDTAQVTDTENVPSPKKSLPTSPRSLDAILRLAGDSISVENQKYIKEDKEEKKESLLTRIKSLKKSDSKREKEKIKKNSQDRGSERSKTPTYMESDIMYTGQRHKDSIVEYIHIPLNPTEEELNKISVQEKSIEAETKEISNEHTEIGQTPQISKMTASKDNDDKKSRNVIFKTQQSSEKEKEDIPMVYPGLRHKDSIVEYIHISLNPTEEELRREKQQQEIRERVSKTKTKTEIKEQKKKDNKITDKKAIKSTEEKENVPMVYPGLRHEDSVVEYIHISLNPTEEELNALKHEEERKEKEKTNISVIESSESKPKTNVPEQKTKNTKTLDKEETKSKEDVPMVYPGLRHEDSVVEYIHIPLNPSEEELIKLKEQEEAKEKDKLEITEKKIAKTKPKIEKEKPKQIKKNIESEQVAIKPKDEKENVPMVYPGLRHEDSVVEYIHIPLNPSEEELNKLKELEQTKEKEKITEKKVAKTKPKMEKQEAIKPKNEEANVPMVYPGLRHEDSIVEYIHIPLTPTEKELEAEEKNTLQKITSDKETLKSKETTVLEIQEKSAKKDTRTSETQPKESLDKENILLTPTEEDLKAQEESRLTEKMEISSFEPPTNKKPEEEKPEGKQNIIRKKDTKVVETKTEKENVPMFYPGIRHQDSVVEYTHIPLNPTEDELKKEALSKSNKNIKKPKGTVSSEEPMATEDISNKKVGETVEQKSTKKEKSPPKWRGLKVGLKVDKKSPPIKKKPAKKISPKSEKKLESIQTSVTPVAMRREDSIVEYIHIPLNPTEEELAAEKKQERQVEDKSEVGNIETTPQPTKRFEDPAKDTSKGAIKKQPQEKSKVKDATSKLTEDIKKFASKLKELQKKSKKPTFKTFKRGSILGSKKPSPPPAKKPVGDPLRIRPRREDSPVEYIHIPLNPSPDQLRLEQEREKLRQLAKKPTAEEIQREKEKARLRRISKTPAVPTKSISKTTVTTKKAKPKKKPSTSTFETLKKTKELSKAKLKVLKETVQQTKDKIMEKKVPATEGKLKEESKQTEVRSRRKDSPDYVFVPLKGPEVEAKQVDNIEIIENVLSEKQQDSTVQNLPEKEIQKKDDIKEIAQVEEKDLDKLTEEETHFYEPISKEDEEDGLKTAILISKEAKDEEQSLKSVLKVADSPKLHKKVSFKRKSASVDTEQGEPDSEKPEKPSRRKPTKSVEEPPTTADRDEDQEKWSKSTDHEYEPINPPADPEAVVFKPIEAPPPVHVTQLTDFKDENRASPQPEPELAADVELRQLRIPLDDELIVASPTPEPDRSSPYTEATWLGTPTLSSRTEGISTSQVDSAVLEQLPLKKEDRKKKLDEMEQPETHGPNIQEKLRTQAGKLKTKFKNIKKPTFSIPNPKFSPKFKRPKFQRPKFERPKFQRPKFETPKFTMPSMPSMPKMPDRPKINFPSFSLPRPGSMKRQRPAEDQVISTTESSADSKKNIFDFRTYPRLFDKSKKKPAAQDEPKPEPEFATVPRAAARKKGPIGARWVHRFTDIQFADDEEKKPASYSDELHSKDRGDSLERRMEADLRYEQALAEADEEMREYDRENQNISRHSPYHVDNQEYTDRWRHGSFHRREELARQEAQRQLDYGSQSQQSNRDERSSVASSGHRGVIEEIDSDQFFLREKGISQDNLQVGLYLSSEIRDAFRQPVNALSQMERDYELDASDISLTRPRRPKRKHLKKTKRVKKTPHASHEQLSFDQESVNTEPEEFNRDLNTFPMPRPRRTKRSKILARDESLETSHSEMPVDDEVDLNSDNLKSQENLQEKVSSESIPNILGYVEKDSDISEEYNKYLNDDSLMYENEVMQDIEQPEIVINSNQKYEIETKDVDKYLEQTGQVGTPKPPTRRHRSLKSLNLSEHDSILGEFNRDKMLQDILNEELNVYHMEHDYIIPEVDKPVAPRRNRSRSRTISQAEDDRTSHGAESLITESEEVCEAPCRQELRDCLGYAIIDKSQKYRDAPLPSTPRRQRKSNKSPADTKFFTVPRALNDAPPVRPSRNYSTLTSSRPSRKRSDLDLTTEEKENIDISQYIEIEDDSRDLQSGDVISKMQSRPLPAPPRPPRKTRDRSKENALRDITQESNIISDTIIEHEKTLDISPASPIEAVEEIEVSTQTDALPDDFCCEEFVQEPTDRVIAPTRRKRSIQRDSSIQSLERPKTPLEKDSGLSRSYERTRTSLERTSSPNAMIIERKVRTPVEDETITHASLLVRPVPEYPRDSFVSKRFGADIPDILQEKIIPHSSPHSETEDELHDLELEEMRRPISEVLSSETETSTMLPHSTEEPFSSARDISELLTEPSAATPVPFESEILEEQTAEIPEKPQRRKSQSQMPSRVDTAPQPQIIERIIERQVPVCVTPGPDTEVEVLKAQRLQVAELDVEKLNVSELQANKILVSEIDGMSLQISELTSKSGNLVINGLEFPSGLIQEILDRIHPSSEPPQESSKSTEQVSTQTSIEEPEPNDKEFTEPSREQVATQTSIETLDEKIQPVSTEQISTQTSIEEPEDSIIPEEFTQLKSVPVVYKDLAQILVEENIESEEEFEELLAMPVIAEQLEHITDSIAPRELARLSSASPTIVVDPPEQAFEEPEPEPEPEVVEERDAIADIRERIRFIEEEMNEFISDFTPDEMSEIKTEIESIIDIASERVKTSQEDITIEEPEEIIIYSDSPTQEFVISENITEPMDIFIPYSREDSLDQMPELETDFMFLPQELMFPVQHPGVIVEEYLESTPSQSVRLTEILEPQTSNIEIDKSKIIDKNETDETTVKISNKPETDTKLDENKIIKQKPLSTETTDDSKVKISNRFDIQLVQLEPEDSVAPKEFHELMSEQSKILENIEKQIKKEVISSTPESKTDTKDDNTQTQKTDPPPRPPPPSQEHISEHVPTGQIFHDYHYPLSYYPEFVSSVPPPSFYTLRSTPGQQLSDDEVPVHHRRRRHHRHLSRSRSSSDDDKPAVSRRHRTRTPEPSIPQLTGQLARACSASASRIIRQLSSNLGSHLGTREGKHDMQIALVILLVLIAGLILLGYGSGQTVHLHHWEYFNPPKEL